MGEKQRLVVIGNGMAGARFVEELLTRGGSDLFDIAVFGEEPHGNYNRILLSSVLAGTHDPQDIFINPLSWYAENGVNLHAGVRAQQINRSTKQVIGAGSIVEPYDKLVIATGSKPFVPPVEGLYSDDARDCAQISSPTRRDERSAIRHPPSAIRHYKEGVFVFRTLDDCHSIMQYAHQSRKAAVIGGGLLGLEAARGLLNLGVETHVVHLMPFLMEMQLDASGGAVLKRTLEQMGIIVHLEKNTTAILGEGRVTGLAFKDGTTLECDMVVISAGIRPNVDLAREAGLTIERGIVVGDDLACPNDSDIYAIGECAEHRGQLYGLVAPLWEQARVLADRLSQRQPDASYRGSKVSTKLKVMGVELVVMGAKDASGPDEEVVTYTEPARGIYKKLITRDGRLTGAILLGDGLTAPMLLQAFDRATPLPENPAELLFSFTSQLQPLSLAEMPDTEQICNCNGVSKGRIIAVAKAGHRTVEAIGDVTRAGTGCGSCRPEIQAILEMVIGSTAVEESEQLRIADSSIADCGLRIADLKTTSLSNPKSEIRNPKFSRGPSRNKIEEYKQEKDGLDILYDIPRYAEEGWEAITEADRERLKWAGIFFRRQTPGYFMMRIRMPNGITNADQLRAIAWLSQQFGKGFVDITTRQQIQLRWFMIDHVPKILERLEAVGLTTLQTGMDNIRNVIGCPVAGLTSQELFDASPAVREFTEMFVGNRAFTNLPRKFNVAITGCLENCVHAESQDIALTPATRELGGEEVSGFNVAVGGKMGSGGYRIASPLDLFVRPEEAAEICSQIALIFRDFGSREARNRARLAFLVEEWGVEKFRWALEARVGRLLPTAGRDARLNKKTDHIGSFRQKQRGLNYVGLVVPVGRITSNQLFEMARLAEVYGNGEVRVTTSQNLILPNVPDQKIGDFSQEPLLKELSYNPSEITRGLVSCTGMDYCHMALIETKELAIKTARYLEQKLGNTKPLSIHWSGCPAGCGNHAVADIGLLGKSVRLDGKVIDAVDVFVGGRAGSVSKAPLKLLENVPCSSLPEVLERLVPYLNTKV